MKKVFANAVIALGLHLVAVGSPGIEPSSADSTAGARADGPGPYVMVLGIAQDGGYPQAGCRRECCGDAWRDTSRRRHVSSLAILDPGTGQRWLVDATPDFRAQLRMLDELAPVPEVPGLAGVLLTHGHIGHYTGLIHLGREVLGTREVPVWALPRMARFLRANGPWDQLVRLRNIDVREVAPGEPISLSRQVKATPIVVPHRQEYTETVGYRVEGPNRSLLYIPDIDDWEPLGRPIEEHIREVDVAYLDGTFFSGDELPGRDLSQIPHPFIMESMALFAALPETERSKVRFIHLNHTNPALDPAGEARRRIEAAGMAVAEELEREKL